MQKGNAYRIQQLISACTKHILLGHSNIHTKTLPFRSIQQTWLWSFRCKIFNKIFDFKFLLRQSFGFCLWLFAIKLDRCEWFMHTHSIAHTHTHLMDAGNETGIMTMSMGFCEIVDVDVPKYLHTPNKKAFIRNAHIASCNLAHWSECGCESVCDCNEIIVEIYYKHE